MHRGYIKLWRKIEDSFLMYDPDAIWLWIRLLLKANHKETEFMFNGKKIILKRGQLITGRKSLVDKHKISESKVFRLLKLFENEHLIEQQKTNRYSIISIVCYNQYQETEQLSEQPVNNQRTTTEQPVNTSKELISIKKNEKNIISPTKVIQDFFYQEYEKTFGEKYVANFGKDGAIFKDILSVLPEERVKSLILAFFQSKDEFIQKTGYTVGVFKSQINKLKNPTTALDHIYAKAGIRKE